MEDQSGKINVLLSRNVEQVIDKEHLANLLRSGKKLRIKLGIDPTGKKIHIGRAIVLWKLREFQDLGHKVVLIIGDYTALIGDPSDKLEKRPMLTDAQIKENLKGYLAQIGKILNLRKVEVKYNSKWLKKLNFKDILELTDLFSASQIIERRNFKDRWDKEEEISLRELMYPIMQGYDSVAVKADVELGGTDQLFNLLAGRKVQQHCGQKQQDVLITAMLDGTDGRKMSTSWGNVINISDEPDEQYGKVMAARDEVIVQYLKLATDLPLEKISGYERALKDGVNPKDIKQHLAAAIVGRYHGAQAAINAGENWEKMFSKKDLANANIPEYIVSGSTSTTAVVMNSGVATSKSEARRLIEQGGVSVNDEVRKDPQEELKFNNGDTLKIGKKKFFRVKI